MVTYTESSLLKALPAAWSVRSRLCGAIPSLALPSGTALKPHILTSGTPFMACMNTNPMSKTYPAETATTAVGFARLGRPFSRSMSQPAIGKICNAWIPKKCATLKSPPVVLQLSTGSPGPPGATPTTLCPCATITPPMADPARKRKSPNAIPS